MCVETYSLWQPDWWKITLQDKPNQFNSTIMFIKTRGQACCRQSRSTARKRGRLEAGSSTSQRNLQTRSKMSRCSKTVAMANPHKHNHQHRLSYPLRHTGFCTLYTIPLLQLIDFSLYIPSFSWPIFLSVSLLEGYRQTSQESPTYHIRPSSSGQQASECFVFLRSQTFGIVSL